MRLKITWILAASILLWPAAFAQDTPIKSKNARFGDPTATARQMQDLFYGVIKSVDKNEVVLEKTKVGVDQTVKLTPKTKYVADGKPAKFEQLKVGDQVWLSLKTDKKTGDMIAEKVYAGVIAPTVRK